MSPFIDINCDLGEEMDIEAAIMPFITTANIACGGHAGNTKTIQSTIALAKNIRLLLERIPLTPIAKILDA